jgi:two-component system nitrogen regulation sensor histidine kinase NtrY
MVERSRSLQLQFNAALLLISLLIVAAVNLDRAHGCRSLVRPVGEIGGGRPRVAAGDLSARRYLTADAG